MEKTRARKGEPYWFVDIDGKVWDRYERNEVLDSILFGIGNYFHSKKDAEQMNKKFLAILRGADVIETPSDEEICDEAAVRYPSTWNGKPNSEGGYEIPQGFSAFIKGVKNG